MTKARTQKTRLRLKTWGGFHIFAFYENRRFIKVIAS